MKRQTITALLTALCISSMTACSFQFSTEHDALPSTFQTIDFSIGESLSDIVDEINFTDDESIASGVEKVTEWADSYAEESSYLDEFQSAKLIRVVDGDTIVVEIQNDEYKVRLIGINTPESVATEEYLERTGKENTKEGVKASDFTKEILSNADIVYLQKDTSNTDKYGRLLRYVWLEVPQDPEALEEISTKMLNGILVTEGYADAIAYEPDTLYQDEFEELEH